MQQEAGIWQIRRQPGIRSHVLGDGMSPPSRELGVSRTVTALSRAVSIVSTSNAGKAPQLPGSSACSRGCTHGKGDCRKCGFGGRGRTTIPAAAACSFSAFSHSYLSPKRYAPADGQTVNLGIIFGFFSPCAPIYGTGGIAVRVSLFGAFCVLSGGGIYSISGFENKLYLFRALCCISRADSV